MELKKIYLLMFCLAILPSVLATNLELSNLDDIILDDLSHQNMDVTFVFEVFAYDEVNNVSHHPESPTLLGKKYLTTGSSDYYDCIDCNIGLMPVALKLTTDGNADIKAGESIDLVYGSESITVYLPQMEGHVFDFLYIDDSGNTYYDDELTELAGTQPMIQGVRVLTPNDQETYTIELTTTTPDTDYSDGNYQVQYANYGLMDSDNNILVEGSWQEVEGVYQTQVMLENLVVGDYILFAVITQFDMTFDSQSGTWITSDEYILVNEAISITVEHAITPPTSPNPSGFSNLLDSLMNWLSGLWDLLF